MSKVKANIIDRAVSFFSPSAGYKRLQYRDAMNLFEGAGRSRRTAGWKTPSTSIQADTRRGLALLRSRARDLGQNNAYAAAAHRELPANIIGTGLVPHPDLPDPDARAPFEQLIKRWFGTPACDADNRLNFYGLQNLATKTVVESGEVLIVKRPRMAGNTGIPLQVQVMEPDHIDTLKDGVLNHDNGNVIIQGVEFDRQGQRVAYWLFDHHPGDQFYRFTNLTSRRVPADAVQHMFRLDRAGQVRGVPWGAPVIITLRDFDEFEDAQLVRQKIAACFSVFITPGEQFGPNRSTDDDTERLLPEKVEPGIIEELRDGKDVKFANPPGVQGYGEYSTISMHKIATGYGVPFSVLTGDLRQVNFSSGRMGDRAFNRNVMHWQRNLVIPQMCQPVWDWFMEAAVAARQIREPIPARWSPPRRELTDPAREIPAIRDAVRSMLITHPEAIRQQGFDPDDVVREAEDWNKSIDEARLVTDSDPRKVSANGLTQARPEGTEIPSTEVNDDETNE